MSWLDWKHIAEIKSDIVNNNKAKCITKNGVKEDCKPTSTQYMVGIAYDDWTVYMWGTNNINGKMYSFSQEPPSSCDVGHNGQDNPPGCWNMNIATQTGLGKWKDIDGDKTWGLDKDGNAAYIGTELNDSLEGWRGFSKHSISGQGNAGSSASTGHLISTVYWINFADASAKAKTIPSCNVFVFDHVLMKAEYYEAAWRSIAVMDGDSDVFVKDSFLPTYENAFCVKNANGKYLYYDFINQDTPKLALGDTCLATGAIPEDPTKASAALGEAMGAVWGYSANLDPDKPSSEICLQNLNPGLSAASNITASYSSGALAANCTSDGNPYKSGTNSPERWLLNSSGAFTNGSKCMYADGTTIKFADASSGSCNNQWSMVSLLNDGNFCSDPVCGANAEQVCKEKHDYGTCDCTKTYGSSDPCYQKCADYNKCTANCLGPTLAMQCYN
jgi:hypothetical protein